MVQHTISRPLLLKAALYIALSLLPFLFESSSAFGQSAYRLSSILPHPDEKHLFVFASMSFIPPRFPSPPAAPTPSIRQSVFRWPRQSSMIAGRLHYCCLEEGITTASLWNVQTGECEWVRPVDSWSTPRLSPDGRTLVDFQIGGCEGEYAHLAAYDALTLEKLHEWDFDQVPIFAFSEFQISADSSSAAVRGVNIDEKLEICVLELRSGKIRRRLRGKGFEGMALAADGSLLAVVRSTNQTSSRTLSVIETRSGKSRFTIPCRGYSVRFSSDSETVLLRLEDAGGSSPADQSIEAAFSARDGSFLDALVTPKAGEPYQYNGQWRPSPEAPVRWSIQSRSPAISASRNTAPSWELVLHDSRRASPEEHFVIPAQQEVTHVQVSPGAQWIAGISGSSVCIWDAQSAQLSRTLDCAGPLGLY